MRWLGGEGVWDWQKEMHPLCYLQYSISIECNVSTQAWRFDLMQLRSVCFYPVASSTQQPDTTVNRQERAAVTIVTPQREKSKV